MIRSFDFALYARLLEKLLDTMDSGSTKRFFLTKQTLSFDGASKSVLVKASGSYTPMKMPCVRVSYTALRKMLNDDWSYFGEEDIKWERE